MADLTREVENHVPPADEVIHGALLADVGDVHAQSIGQTVYIEQVAAVLRDQGVDQEDARAQVDQPAGQIAANEPEAAGDQHLAATVELQVVHDQVRRAFGSTPPPALAGRTAGVRR